MKLQLPDIRTFIKNEWHSLLKNDEGIWLLMDEPFQNRLTGFLQKFEISRKTKTGNLLTPSVHPALPFGEHKQDVQEWKFRQNSLAVINKILDNREGQSILEVGSWNGWLTHRLAAAGHTVLAMDYFLDDRDGLKTKRYYSEEWLALQADISNPVFLSVKFDLIVVNHCLQFFSNPLSYIEILQGILKPGGILVILGLSIYKNPLKKAKEVEQFRQVNTAKYGISFLNPTKGYLDIEDKGKLEEKGITFKLYNSMFVRNLYSKLYPYKPIYIYGVYSS